jgi:hypothetical protein
MTTWARRTWLLPNGDLHSVLPVDWPGTGHDVFVTYGGVGYRLLDVAGPGGSLLADSTRIRNPAGLKGLYGVDGAMLLPGDKDLLTGYVRLSAVSHGKRLVTGLIVETSASTRRPVRVLFKETARIPASALPFCYPVSLGPSQINALIACMSSFGRLDGSHFTALRGVTMPTPGSRAAW